MTSKDKTTRVLVPFGEEFTLNNSYVDYQFAAQTVNGFFSLQYAFNASSHADARITIDLWYSADGETYCRSSDGYNIVTDAHKASGTDSDGKDLLKFEPSVAGQFKLRITETASQNATLKLWLVVR